MRAIVHNWLMSLGIFVQIDHLGEYFRDGTTLVRILKYYNIVNAESVKNIAPSENHHVCINNLKQLKLPFELLGIPYDDQTVRDICFGSTSACMKILGKLFSILENTTSLPVVGKQAERTYIGRTDTRFQAKKVSESELKNNSRSVSYDYKTKIREHGDVISWYKSKARSNQGKKCKKETPSGKPNGVSTRKQTKPKTEVLDDDELGKYTRLKRVHCTPSLDCKTTFAGNRLYNSKRNPKDKYRDKCELLLLDELWETVQEKEEADFTEIFSDKFLKQSRYEKQMSMKMCQILHQDNVHKRAYQEIKKRIEQIKVGESISLRRDTDIENHLYYQSEIKRTVELHRKLYADKFKLRFEKHYVLCKETLEDMVDLAIRRSEYENLYKISLTDKIWSEWKSLFFYGLPIFDIVEDIKELLLETRKDGYYSEENKFEWERQDVMNENNLDKYLNLANEWDVNIFWPEGLPLKISDNFPLGYAVHRLLEIKYPLPPLPEPADVPRYPITAVVNNIEDVSATERLGYLLRKREIFLVDVNSAISYCLQAFKECESVMYGSVIDASDPKGHHSADNTFETPTGEKNTVPGTEILQNENRQRMDAEVQTSSPSNNSFEKKPDIFETARIGNKVFNNLLSGSEISVSLIVEAVIELIKNQKNIKGWVLINFPSTLYQASLLEFAFTSQKFPYKVQDDSFEVFKDICCTMAGRESTSSSKESYTINNEDARISKLVPDPRRYDDVGTFRTYFSRFVKMTRGREQSPSASAPSDIQRFRQSRLSGENESTLLLEHPEKEGVPTLYTFYQDQEVLSNFTYESLDKRAVKQLARLLLGNTRAEDSVDSITSDSALAPNQTISDFSEPSDCQISDSKTNEELTSSPSRTTAVYADLPIPQYLSNILANFWEGLESVYLNNLKDAFFAMRKCELSVEPFIHYLFRMLKSCISRTDCRQEVVKSFVDNFNSIHQLLRFDPDMKLELHCRVSELETELRRICEEKRSYSERTRQTIMDSNWTAEHMALMANTYVTMLQIESNRCSSTLQLLQDYYLIMLKVFKAEYVSTVTLNKINFQEDSSTISTSSTSSSSTWENLRSQIRERLSRKQKDATDANPFFMFVDSQATSVFNSVKRNKLLTENLIHKEEARMVSEFHVRTELRKRELSKTNQSQKLERAEDEDAKTSFSSGDDGELKKLKNLFSEWTLAMQSEIERTLFRAELIRRKAKNDLAELEQLIASTFKLYQKATAERFAQESECVRKLCRLLGTAIEEKTALYADIVFRQNTFYVERQSVEKLVVMPKLPATLAESELESTLTVRQLDILFQRLSFTAPRGAIGKAALVNVIQDMIICGTDINQVRLMPEIWKKLGGKKTSSVVYKLFGNTGLIDWRDFLVICLELPYPVMEDIIDAKLQFSRFDTEGFESVSYENYMEVTMWFERELPASPKQALRNVLAKSFLYKLYKSFTLNRINYTALLLAFCKDADPKVGIGKALALITGRCVILYEEDMYLEKIMTDCIDTEHKVVNMILDDILTSIVETEFGYANTSRFDTTVGSLQEIHWLSEYTPPEEDYTILNYSSPYMPQYTFEQFIRRVGQLNWTSTVPYQAVNSLVIAKYLPQVPPSSVNLSTNYIRELVAQVHGNEIKLDVEARKFFEQLFKVKMFAVNRFQAFSITEVIDDILDYYR